MLLEHILEPVAHSTYDHKCTYWYTSDRQSLKYQICSVVVNSVLGDKILVINFFHSNEENN